MEKRGFWQVAVSLDSTHAQWRTFVSLTLVFILPMVGFSHDWSVLPHAEVCSSSRWPVDSSTGVRLFFPSHAGWNPHAEVGYVFPVYFAVECKLPHSQTVEVVFPCESRAHCLCFGTVVFPVPCGMWCPIAFWATVDS